MLRPGEGRAGIGGERMPYLKILHLFSAFLLVGVTFAACAAPQPENRRRSLMWSGLFSLFVVISGFAQLGIMGAGFPGWAIVKLLCWLVLLVATGIVFRKPNQIKAWLVASLVAIFVALWMVTFRPF